VLIHLPFRDECGIVFCERFASFVTHIQAELVHWGVKRIQAFCDVNDLGLNIDEQYPSLVTELRRCNNAAPECSIISAGYNNARKVKSFVDSLAYQIGIQHAQLIYVDDGSNDDFNPELVIDALDRDVWDVDVVVLGRTRCYVPGTFSFRAGAARDIGVTRARSDVLIFIDPDQKVCADCVRQHLDAIQCRDVVIGARDAAAVHGEPFAGMQDWWLRFYTANASVRRQTFDRAGGFDATLQYWGLDDTDLGYRLHRTRASVGTCPRGIVTQLEKSDRMQPLFWENQRLHMEVLYRKYLDESVLNAYEFLQGRGRDFHPALRK
jgi:GT2 family glycosyltransferase